MCIPLISCVSPSAEKELPVAVNGILDLKNWDLEKDGILELKGEWKFKWMETRDEYAKPDYDDSDWDLYNIPNFWNKKVNSKYGYAWFRLKVINVKSDQLIALYLLNVVTEYDLYCNGKQILKNGKTGTTREESIPQRIPLYTPLENNKEFVLAWHISNFDNTRSGPGYSPKIGLFKKIRINVFLENFFLFIIFGIIAMMAIYHFVLWLFLKEDKASLYFSIFCFIMDLRMILFYKFINQIFPDINIYEIITKIEVIAVPCALILFLLFCSKIFPLEFSPLIFKIICIVNVFFIGFVFLSPLWIMTYFLDIYLISLLLSGGWIVIMNIIALKRKRPGALVMFCGFLLLFCTMILDFIAIFLPRIYINSTQVGLAGFLFSQAILISRRFTSAYKTAKHLSKNLQAEVEEQTKIIREKNEELINLNREKTNYFINLAHETKNPLTLISNYLEKYIEERGIDENLSIIQENFNKLKTDMVNFLDYEKLILGQVFYNHDQGVDFSYILKSKIPLFIKLAKNKKIILTTSIEDNIYIKADPSAVDRLANNIIENAIKYTGMGGSITISLKYEEDNAVFCLKDTGIGISEEQKKHIFEPYYQISHKKRNIQGMGMGLNIVNKIIEEIHGEIQVESELDKGTTFTIIIQKYKVTEGEEIVKEVDTNTIPMYKTKEKLKENKIIQGRYNIFIVEDNIDMLSYLQISLMDSYNVFYALNGKDALRKIDHMPMPHIIISDIMMDKMDGYEFYEELKAKIEYSFIPFIFLTALTSRDEKIKGIKKGAVDFISKPFDIKELKVKIESLIKLQESQKIRSELEVEERILNAIRNRASKDDVFYRFENRCLKFKITEREKEVVWMLLQGKEDKEISYELNTSFHTIRAHIRNIYKKCRIKNKVELVNIFKNI